MANSLKLVLLTLFFFCFCLTGYALTPHPGIEDRTRRWIPASSVDSGSRKMMNNKPSGGCWDLVSRFLEAWCYFNCQRLEVDDERRRQLSSTLMSGTNPYKSLRPRPVPLGPHISCLPYQRCRFAPPPRD